jgi:hypothetical protein
MNAMPPARSLLDVPSNLAADSALILALPSRVCHMRAILRAWAARATICLLLGVASTAVLVSVLAPRGDDGDWDRAHASVQQTIRERMQEMRDSGRIAKRWPHESDADYAWSMKTLNNLCNDLGVSQPSPAR